MQLNGPHTDHEHASVSLKVLLLIFGLILVAALGYFVWMQNTASDTTDNTSPNVKQEATTETTTTTDETADWKTYTNTEHGYSIMYPQAWIKADKVFYFEGVDLVLLSAERDADIKRLAGQGGDATPSLRITYYSSSKDLQTTDGEKSNKASLLDWLKSESEKKQTDGQADGWVVSYKSKTIAGYSGYEAEQPNIGGITYWYIEHNGHVYAFDFDDAGSEQVIATFKFTK